MGLGRPSGESDRAMVGGQPETPAFAFRAHSRLACCKLGCMSSHEIPLDQSLLMAHPSTQLHWPARKRANACAFLSFALAFVGPSPRSALPQLGVAQPQQMTSPIAQRAKSMPKTLRSPLAVVSASSIETQEEVRQRRWAKSTVDFVFPSSAIDAGQSQPKKRLQLIYPNSVDPPPWSVWSVWHQRWRSNPA